MLSSMKYIQTKILHWLAFSWKTCSIPRNTFTWKKCICTGILQVYRCSGISAKIYTVWDFTRRCTLLIEIHLRIKIHVAWEFTSRQMLFSEKWIYAEWDFTSRHMFSQGWLNSVLSDGSQSRRKNILKSKIYK